MERFNLLWPKDGRRTPGPLDPDETGPVAGDIVVPEGQPVYIGGSVPIKLPRPIRLKLPLDISEVGTAYNGYTFE